MTALALALVVCVVALLVPGRGEAARLRRLMPPEPAPMAEVPAHLETGLSFDRFRVLAALTAGAAALLVIPWPWAPALATILVIGVVTIVPQLDRRSHRDAKRQRQHDLPLTLDLLAACWSAGVLPRQAAATVAAAIGGPIGTNLRDVAIRLDLGSTPEDAWRFLVRDLDDDGARDAYRAVVAAASSGVPPVGALRRAATRSRDVRRRSGEAAARTVAVKVAAPLGLCFLPAFVLLAIAPAVLGALGPVLR